MYFNNYGNHMNIRTILLIIITLAILTPLDAANKIDKDYDNLKVYFNKFQSMTKQDFIDAYKKTHPRIPLSSMKFKDQLLKSNPKAEINSTKPKIGNSIQSAPENITFPGEFEEVKAIVITWPYLTVDSTGEYTEQLFDGIGYYIDTLKWEYNLGPVYSFIDTFPDSPYPYVFSNLAHAIDSQAEVWINIWYPDDSVIVKKYMASKNMPLKNYKFFVNPGNSFWYRDCGPVAFYYGDQDSIGFIDFEYYTGRPLDDAIPINISEKEGIPVFTTGIEYEGGNILLDGKGSLITTDAVYATNSDTLGQYFIDNEGNIDLHIKKPLMANRVRDSLVRILNLNKIKILPSLKFDGGTGHIDLYADMYDENTFVFSKYPDELKSFQDYTITSRNIDTIMSITTANNGKYLKRYIPFPRKDNGMWYSSEIEYYYFTRTYSNHTFVNKTIIQPVFSDGETGDMTNMKKDLETLKKQYPGYTIYPIDVRSFDGAGGAIHCITKQIPAENPLRIFHQPIEPQSESRNSYPVTANIYNHSGIASASVKWRYSESKDWNTLALDKSTDNNFNAEIPNDKQNGSIDYYIEATSNNGKTITKPITAPEGYYTFAYSVNVSDVNDNQNIKDFAGEFYPNPASSQSGIVFNSISGSIIITIYSVTGNIVYSSKVDILEGDNMIQLNTGSFSVGSYLVSLKTSDGRTAHRMLNVIR